MYQMLNAGIFYKCNGHLLSFFAFKAGKCQFMFYAFIEGIPKKTSPEWYGFYCLSLKNNACDLQK